MDYETATNRGRKYSRQEILEGSLDRVIREKTQVLGTLVEVRNETDPRRRKVMQATANTRLHDLNESVAVLEELLK